MEQCFKCCNKYWQDLKVDYNKCWNKVNLQRKIAEGRDQFWGCHPSNINYFDLHTLQGEESLLSLSQVYYDQPFFVAKTSKALLQTCMRFRDQDYVIIVKTSLDRCT